MCGWGRAKGRGKSVLNNVIALSFCGFVVMLLAPILYSEAHMLLWEASHG